MARQYFSSCLLLLIFSACITEVVWAAPGDLGASCNAGGCTSSDHVCDPVDTICRKKVGISCSSTDNPVNCSTQATCAEGAGQTCTCPSTTHIVSGGLCQLKVDVTCSSTTAKCVTNTVCPSLCGACACNTGYVANSDKTACLLKAGQTGCTDDAQCTANSACPTGTTRTCTCSTNYFAQTSGLCSPKDNTYGGSCTVVSSIDSCVTNGTDPNAVCSAATGGTCGCKSGYTATVGVKCSPKDNTYGGSCTIVSSVDSCATNGTDPNAVCSAATGGTCGCKSGYTATVGVKCSPKDNTYGGSCTIVSSVDSCVTNGTDPNAVCSAATGGMCGCKSGYTATVGVKCSGAMTFAGSVFLLFAALILTTYLQ